MMNQTRNNDTEKGGERDTTILSASGCDVFRMDRMPKDPIHNEVRPS